MKKGEFGRHWLKATKPVTDTARKTAAGVKIALEKVEQLYRSE